MPSIADIYAEVSPTLSPEGKRRFERALGKMDGHRAGVSIGQSLGNGMRVSLFKSAKGLGGVLAAGFAAIKVGGFLKGAIGEASDLNETVNKATVIFGKNSKSIRAWANTAAKSFGLSKNEALGAAAGFGDMFRQLGIGGDRAAKMSTGVVKLAADLGSFNNLPTAQVLEMISAGFRGEYDSLQRVIPNISAARVQQEALRMTHKKSVTDLTAAEKATATLAIVQHDGARAAGDFARTSGGLANQQKILSAQFTDFKSSIGQIALPLAARLFRFFNDQGIPALHKVATFLGRVRTAFVQGLAGNVSTEGGLFRYVAQLAERLVTFRTWVQDTAVPGIVSAFGTVKGKIEASLPSIDLSGLAKSFTEQAKGWGTALINGVKQGLDTGDWSGLGETVGRGLVAAIGAAANLAKNIAGKIGELFGKVDWIGLGITVGKQAIPFIAGLAIGILNVDLLGLLKGLAEHWREAIVAVIAIALTPAKIIGPVGRLLARIPLVGKFLETALLWMKGLSDGLVRGAGRAVAFVGREILAGFRTVFPVVGKALSGWLELLPIRIGVAALDLRAAAIRMIRGLGRAILDSAVWVLRNIGQLIAMMLRPWVRAGGWLLNAGRQFVGGLIGGIRSYLGLAGHAASGVITRVTAPFRAAGGWLLAAGRDLIGGLFAGIRAAMSKVGDILGSVKDAIVGGLKRLFHIGSPSKVMAELGGHMITGLIKGLLTQSGALAQTVKSIGGNIAGIFGGIDLGFGKGSTASGAMQSMVAGYANLLYGWSGRQWDALRNLVMGESGFNPNAQNPTSSAYGLFQFLDSTWASVNAQKTSNPQAQAIAGLRYIKKVYGDPINAYSTWLSRSPHWYGMGGLITEPILGVGRSGRMYGFGERGTERVTPGAGPVSAAAPSTTTIEHHWHVQGIAPFTARDSVEVWERYAIMHGL